MRRILRARLLASALAVAVLPVIASAVPAEAQIYGEVSFDSFHDQLAPYGYWLYSDRWGLVWQPADVPDDFRPYYSDGHWVYTDDYGWFWSSNYEWGDIAFHYGRWVNDPEDGWLWIPGYTWSPGWVVWRSNGEYIGWMPAPPDRAFLEGVSDVHLGLSFGLGGGGISFNWNDPYYGYRTWYGAGFDQRRFADNWVFVGAGHVADSDYRPVVVRNPVQVVNIIQNTTNVTHYTVVNNYVVNKSVDIRVVERAAGHPIVAAPARTVIRQPNLVMRVDQSQRIQVRERMIAPHGTGIANSAPPPPPSVVNKLSARAPARASGQPSHLFTRTTVSNPEVQSKFHGTPQPHAGQPMGGPGGMMGPGATGPAGQQPAGVPRQHETTGQPGGMMGPGAGGPGSQPTEQPRRHEPTGQPGGMMGPGAGGPGSQPTEQPRRHEPTGQPGGMMGPGASGPGGPQPGEVPRQHEPTGQPGGMMGPGAGGPGGQPTEQPRRHEPTGQPGGMMGPGAGEPGGPPAEPPRRHEPTGQPGGMMGPGPTGPGGPPAEPPRRREPTGQPGGMMGPGPGGPGPMPGARSPAPPTREQAPPPASQQPPKTEKEKKEHPQPPPGTPQ